MALKINGELIDDALLRQEARAIRPQLQQAMAGAEPAEIEDRVRQWARENIIERVVLRQEAQNDPEPVPPEAVDAILEHIRTRSSGQPGCAEPSLDEARRDAELQVRTERLLSRIAAKVSPPRHKDVGDYYRKHRDEFARPELVRVAHIVKNIEKSDDEAPARQAIEAALAALESGSPFETVANEHSDCAGNGGDLGYFPRGQMVEEFDDVVFSLPVGARSGIFRTRFGFHIAQVLDHKPAGVASLPDVQDVISRRLYEEKVRKATEQYLDRLMAKAEIVDVGRAAVPQEVG